MAKTRVFVMQKIIDELQMMVWPISSRVFEIRCGKYCSISEWMLSKKIFYKEISTQLPQ